MSLLICPVCRGQLRRSGGSLKCPRGHSFDLAREGYVNLLAGSHKPGDSTGDSPAMASSRRAFLEKGYFLPLKTALADCLAASAPVGPGLDVCCGEGYYSSALGERERYAFDLSKEMVRLAAKRREAVCFVANTAAVPLPDASIAAAIHLFAPFHDGELGRVIRPGGLILSVVPGARHLFGLKEALYERPYENDERPPEAPSFVLEDKISVAGRILLRSKEDIAAVLNMTPYGVRSPAEGRARLAALDSLETETAFVICLLRRRK